MKYFNLLFLISILALACNDGDDPQVQNFQEYLDEQVGLTQHNELIACAAGGQVGFLEDAEKPLNMFLKPHWKGIKELKYFVSSSADIDSSDFSQYKEQSEQAIDVAGGFLKRFPLEKPTDDFWAIVSYIAEDTLWHCKPVKYKMNSKPSEFLDPNIQVDQSSKLEPSFSWAEGSIDENIIFFQLLTEKGGETICGTYTTDTNFKFYDLSNVVLNVTHPDMMPSLEENKEYELVLMGVSNDNWVNLISKVEFNTQ